MNWYVPRHSHRGQHFWGGDKSGERYRSAYFERIPGKDDYTLIVGQDKTKTPVGVWHQGDCIRIDPTTQGVQFLGRSDGVLNPSGLLSCSLPRPCGSRLPRSLLTVSQVFDLEAPKYTIVSGPSPRSKRVFTSANEGSMIAMNRSCCS